MCGEYFPDNYWLKIHPRETYNELIVRILNNCSPNNMDKETLIIDLL